MTIVFFPFQSLSLCCGCYSCISVLIRIPNIMLNKIGDIALFCFLSQREMMFCFRFFVVVVNIR